MTYGAFTPHDLAEPALSRRLSPFSAETLLCGAAILLSAAVGLFLLYGRAATQIHFSATPSQTIDMAQATLPAVVLPLRRYGALLDPGSARTRPPVAFAQSVPLRTGFEPLRQPGLRLAKPTLLADLRPSLLNAPLPLPPVRPKQASAAPTAAPQLPPIRPGAPSPVASLPQTAPSQVAALESDVPLPLPRPRDHVLSAGHDDHVSAPPAATRVAVAPSAVPDAVAPPVNNGPSFFDRLFGRAQGLGSAMAYASPEDNGLGGVPGRAGGTAIYEISTHTVHMPDGTKLEAHSGIGPLRDNPSGVTLRMRGATPPNVYQLSMRESLFHGVQALRLTPTGGTTFGRGGLLAHTYMLGPNGDSNGCVVFKNYRAFLAAYETGQVRRLVVVDRLN